MADKAKVISSLQTIVTDLSQSADWHAVHAKIFASQGFTKLADKYNGHADEEREYVGRCIDRLLDLGADVKVETKEARPVFKNAVEFIKYDTDNNAKGLALVDEMIKAAEGDYATYDLLVDYYKDEEEDMRWGEGQMELINCIGLQNWYIRQL